MADKRDYSQMKQEAAANKLPFSPADLKKADDHISIIHLIAGTTRAGEDFHAYISVKPSLYQEFIRKMADGGRVDIEKYGRILHKGFGKVPSEDVKKEMTEKFGIDHDFVRHLAEDVEKLQKTKK